MKIQFIVCGWWYDEWDGKKNQTEFIDALYELKEENDNLDVMWTCHKAPPKIIRDIAIVSIGVNPISIANTPNIKPNGTTGIISGLTSIIPFKKTLKLLFIF